MIVIAINIEIVLARRNTGPVIIKITTFPHLFPKNFVEKKL